VSGKSGGPVGRFDSGGKSAELADLWRILLIRLDFVIGTGITVLNFRERTLNNQRARAGNTVLLAGPGISMGAARFRSPVQRRPGPPDGAVGGGPGRMNSSSQMSGGAFHTQFWPGRGRRDVE